MSHATYGAISIGDDGSARMASWIQTYSKRRFNPLDIHDDDISIIDIAHALSLVNRFTGHTSVAYSVAEHSVRCARLVESWEPWNFNLILEALLHDASEAYIADIARPIKHLPQMAPYRELEHGIERAIALKYETATIMSPLVKRADEILLTTEARDLMGPLCSGWFLRETPLDYPIRPWSADLAEHEFLAMFRRFRPNGE